DVGETWSQDDLEPVVLERPHGVLKVDGEVGNKKAYDPRVWGAKAEEGMAARVVEACQQLGSVGTSLNK
ncbi:MAG: hypothetical protein ACFNLE_04415, partial [Rothia aeria]